MSGSRKDTHGKKTTQESQKEKKPAPLLRQHAFSDVKADFFGVTLKQTFKFKDSSYPYDYANILQHTGLKSDGDYIIVRMGDHLQFHRKKINVEPKPHESIDVQSRMQMFRAKKLEADAVGWKLHISVASEDIEKAWSLICPILTSHEVSGFKMIRPEVLENAFRKNQLNKIDNKQFTIYQFRNSQFDDKKWEIIIKEIDDALQKAGIKPAEERPGVDKKIEGTSYFSYRNDAHPDKPATAIDAADIPAYLAQSADKTLQAYNLSKAADPFENIKPFVGKELK